MASIVSMTTYGNHVPSFSLAYMKVNGVNSSHFHGPSLLGSACICDLSQAVTAAMPGGIVYTLVFLSHQDLIKTIPFVTH